MLKPYALLSVSDKRNIDVFARGLVELGYAILSSGGTSQFLRERGVEIIDVADFTGSPEMLDGRVKTLHPRIHGSILFDRENPVHQRQVNQFDLANIAVVAVNLYPFRRGEKISEDNVKDAIELIDIGGPTLLRAAAKNFGNVTVVVSPDDYETTLNALKQGKLGFSQRRELARKVFDHVSSYDRAIADSLTSSPIDKEYGTVPSTFHQDLPLRMPLRYGENPHQKAGWYSGSQESMFNCFHGKELSYNNLLDLEAALRVVRDFAADAAVAIIKHNNPCGVGISAKSSEDAFQRAYQGDPMSAFGGIVASNRPITAAAATAMHAVFFEIIAAPSFEAEALVILQQKKNLRLVTYTEPKQGGGFEFVPCLGGLLVQTPDEMEELSTWQNVSLIDAGKETLKDLQFAMIVAKHVKSNAIVLAKDLQTIGIGAGQMSRIDAVQVAITKAQAAGHSLKGAVLASDAFFPFRDSIDALSEFGLAGIVEPGGSVKDAEVIAAAKEHNLPLLFSKRRHFRHI
jgi:phosphoribosylaminoimidazolecarboxamide formyltransferase / IMP cyclohydrolase